MKLFHALLCCAALVGCTVVHGPEGPEQPAPEDTAEDGPEPEDLEPEDPEPDDPDVPTDESVDQPAASGNRLIRRIDLNHMSEQRPAWIETRELEQATTIEDALEGIAAEPGVVMTAALRKEDGELVDVRTVSSGCLAGDEYEPRTLLVPTDFATIQGAIDAAEPGDVVRVLAGTYTEHLRLKSGVRLLGSGAVQTILDGQGLGQNLIDFTGAHDVVVSGFTLRNVGQADGCGDPGDPLACSGNWYAAAVYADGHDDLQQDDARCGGASIYFSDNIVTGNDIGMMLYFGPFAMVRNNTFSDNTAAFVANHHGGGTALIADNLFVQNAEEALAVSASYLDVINNVFVENGLVLAQEYCQAGRVRCNVVWNNQTIGERMPLDADGNLEADPLLIDSSTGLPAFDEGSPVHDSACTGEPEPITVDSCGGGSFTDAGAP